LKALRLQHLVLALALVHAAFYCCALPLWEGFDEPAHYGYVESLSAAHKLPVLQRAWLSQEIRESLAIAPLSRLLSQTLPDAVSFEQWAGFSIADKERRRAELKRIPRSARTEPSDFLNYEAQQAPLAYLLYVPFDWLLSGLVLPERILLLRLVGGVASCLLIYFALTRLLDLLGMSSGLRLAVLACVFESQMLWASVAHVGNDVAAIPLTVWFLTWLALTAQQTSNRNMLVLAVIFALGLIAKAYFLAFLPVFAAILLHAARKRAIRGSTLAAVIAIVLAVAAPWYGHNLSLYGSLSGTQQSVAGIGWRAALAALPRIQWLESAGDFARWSLWTGNWSFLSFSRITLNIEIWLVRAALLVYLLFWRRIQTPELWIWAACGCFGLSLIYQTCVTWVATQGASQFAEPWYAQGVIVVVWALCFMGIDRWRSGGRWIGAALLVVSTWVAAMTYFAKLLPYYAGGINRGSVAAIWNWWRGNPTQAIGTVVLAPVPVVYALLTLFTMLLIASAAIILRRLFVDMD